MKYVAHELAVGDSVLIGEKRLTVLEIEGDEITFRLDENEAEFSEFCELEALSSDNLRDVALSRPR